MPLNARRRRLGQTRDDYPFQESLLQVGPHILKEKSLPTFKDVTDLPLSSSDDGSSSLSDADLLGMGTLPSTKRRRLSNVEVSKSKKTHKHGSIDSGSNNDANPSRSSIEPSRISHTTWTSGRGSTGQSESVGKAAQEEADLLSSLGSTKKPRVAYTGTANIHRTISSPGGKPRVINRTQKNGFQNPITTKVEAARTLSCLSAHYRRQLMK